MELKDVTREMLLNKEWDERHNERKIAIVKLAEGNFLTFLVSDVERPEVPGFPATSLSYFASHTDAVEAVKSKLASLGVTPKYQEFGFWT